MNDTSLIVVAIGEMILRPRFAGLQGQSRGSAQIHFFEGSTFTAINVRRGSLLATNCLPTIHESNREPHSGRDRQAL
jgi:hypothetical protein